MVGKNKNEVSTRLTPELCLQQSMDSRVDAMNKALGGERVRYRSSRNPGSFVSFLEGRLEIWDEVKDKTFHGTRMYEKTKEILESKRFGVE